MNFDECNNLALEIEAFLQSCGGPYAIVTMEMQEIILSAVATDQYILRRDADGQIEHFVCYWKIYPSDIELIEDNIKPLNLTRGSVLYVTEHGNKAGRHSLTDVIQELRRRAKGMQGVIWNSKGRGLRKFMNQKGGA